MPEPTKRDLVLDAIAHRDNARIPYMILVQPTIGRMLAQHYGMGDITEVVDNAIEWIGNTLSVARMEELGILQEGEYTDEWGICWHGVGPTRGQVKTPPLDEPSLKGYRFPAPLSPEVLRTMTAQAEKSRHRYRIVKLGALWEQATFLRGMGELLVDLMLHPQFVHELLDGVLEGLLANVERCNAEMDVDGMWLSDDYGSQAGLLMSPELWRGFIRPRVQRLCDAVHASGHHFVLHSDGAIGPVVPDIVEIGVDILHPVQSECVDAAWVKREYGQEVALWGGYGTQGTMVFGTPARVRQEVHGVCDLLGEGGGFILTPGLAIQNEVPVENAAAFIEVALEREKGRF